jgi:hypothetical protein
MATDRALLYGELFWAFMCWGKYLAYADMLRERYEESLELPETEPGPSEESDYFSDPISKSKRSYRLQKDAAIAYYYSSLLPVIEGWKELGLADVAIDELLQRKDGYYDSLRRHRNAIFHFQKEFFGPKESEIWGKGEKGVVWVILITSEFCRFFREVVDGYPAPQNVRDEIRELILSIVGWLPKTAEDLSREVVRTQAYLQKTSEAPHLSEETRQKAHALIARLDNLSQLAIDSFDSLKVFRKELRDRIF